MLLMSIILVIQIIALKEQFTQKLTFAENLLRPSKQSVSWSKKKKTS